MLRKLFYFLLMGISMFFVYGCQTKNMMEDYFNKLPTVKVINAGTIFYLNILPHDKEEELILNYYKELSEAVNNEIKLYEKLLYELLNKEKKYNQVLTDIFLIWRINKEKALLSYDREEDLFNYYLKIKSIEVFMDKVVFNLKNDFRRIKKVERNIDLQVFSEYNLMLLSFLFHRNKVSFLKSISLITKSLALHNLEIPDKDLEKDLTGLYEEEREIALEILLKLRELKKCANRVVYGIFSLEEFRKELLRENIIALKEEIENCEGNIKVSLAKNLFSEKEKKGHELYLEIFKIYLLSLENVNKIITDEMISPSFAQGHVDRLKVIKDSYLDKPTSFQVPKIYIDKEWLAKYLHNADVNTFEKTVTGLSDNFYLFLKHKEDYFSFFDNPFQKYMDEWFKGRIGIGTIDYKSSKKKRVFKQKNNEKINLRWVSCIFGNHIKWNLSLYNEIFQSYIDKPSFRTKEDLKRAFLHSYLINLSYFSSPPRTGGGAIFYSIGRQLRKVLLANEDLIANLYSKKKIRMDKMADFVELMSRKSLRELKRYEKSMSKSRNRFIHGELFKKILAKLPNDLSKLIIKEGSKDFKREAIDLSCEIKKGKRKKQIFFTQKICKYSRISSSKLFNKINLFIRNQCSLFSPAIQKDLKKFS